MEERIALLREDPAFDLSVDGNAIAGTLESMFGAEITAREERCVHCGTISLIGTLRVYMRGPGIVVRCPACTDVVMRLVETPSGVRMDLSGAAGMTLRR
jgi:Family of unknown function (DUF6510)